MARTVQTNFLNVLGPTNDAHTHSSLISYEMFQQMLSCDIGVTWNIVMLFLMCLTHIKLLISKYLVVLSKLERAFV